MNIVIATYNRLCYLQKCVWSILASTRGNYKLIVIDDYSDDGTQDWLMQMVDRGKIQQVILRKSNTGVTHNFNHAINQTQGECFIMANDDMYFHSGWQDAVERIYLKYDDCGIVGFYNFTRINLDEGISDVDPTTKKVLVSGLGACLMNKELFLRTGCFYLPKGRKMGFFATDFCKKAGKVKMKRNKHYFTNPHYASHMDLRHDPLCDRDILEDYTIHRQRHKHGKKT